MQTLCPTPLGEDSLSWPIYDYKYDDLQMTNFDPVLITNMAESFLKDGASACVADDRPNQPGS